MRVDQPGKNGFSRIVQNLIERALGLVVKYLLDHVVFDNHILVIFGLRAPNARKKFSGFDKYCVHRFGTSVRKLGSRSPHFGRHAPPSI